MNDLVSGRGLIKIRVRYDAVLGEETLNVINVNRRRHIVIFNVETYQVFSFNGFSPLEAYRKCRED